MALTFRLMIEPWRGRARACGASTEPHGGKRDAQDQGQRYHHELRAAGYGRAACTDSLSGCGPCLLRLSGRGLWTKTDPFLKAVAVGLASVTDMVIQGIFIWCFTPEPLRGEA